MRLNGKVKLADFGLARRAKDPELADEDIRATPAYAPPEIIRGDKDVPGFKSDMYSFGATAYHILVGHEPFVGADPFKVCDMQLHDTQTPLREVNPNIPARLSDLVDALMAKDPADRPTCWEDVVAELRGIREEVCGRSAGDGEGKSPRLRGVLIAVSAAAVVLILALGAAATFFGPAWWNAAPPPGTPSDRDPAKPQDGPGKQPTVTEVARDEAYYQARWRTLQHEFSGKEPDLKRIEAFVAEAGHFAPAESVRLLQTLHARQGPDQTTNRVLMLRNSLLDRAASFDAKEAEEMDFFTVADLCENAKTQYDELKKLDATLKERIEDLIAERELAAKEAAAAPASEPAPAQA